MFYIVTLHLVFAFVNLNRKYFTLVNISVVNISESMKQRFLLNMGIVPRYNTTDMYSYLQKLHIIIDCNYSRALK